MAVNRTPGDRQVTTLGRMDDRASDSTPEASPDLLLDELDEKLAAFQAFRKGEGAEADDILSSLGAQDDVDHDIVLELSSPSPLGHPERFQQAHRLTVRALEVLDRNGARSVRMGAGPLKPIASFVAQQVTQFIVRSHLAAVTDEMLRLYSRREANAALHDPQGRMLLVARLQMERLSPGFKRNALGAIAFLAGGAAISGIANAAASGARAALSNLYTEIAATVLLGLVIAGLAWTVVRGAAVARRRIQLTLDGPVKALWQTIGRCGKPPKDPSQLFALFGIVLAAVPWLAIPVFLGVRALLRSIG